MTKLDTRYFGCGLRRVLLVCSLKNLVTAIINLFLPRLVYIQQSGAAAARLTGDR